ncbi:MAG: hypothetical protein A2498_14230 [Lentisphaerae bacterium RIFOXYC12_FULL_60_16]|nr:MAG: hypothetical protein A2498_14230 [Lentisphaerae bacterium RIFOXYC12_FULL_60_16]OGV72317.1 MAG: hypothetical protein A2269_00410 [Lentisphaerae bacterium RIFOXYA12_FULL_60_10]OGV79374.1 MAG: hypothetical protein A2340_04945 [Lentisphaerae bacterium RIFOXYB12_FULL_60_10]
MRRTLITLALSTFVITGCGKKTAPETATTPPAVPGDEWLVSVDGQRLTRADAEQEVTVRLSAMQGQIPPEQIPQIENRIRDSIVQQFITRTLLLKEADRQQVQIESDDEQRFYDRIRSSLPPGTTLEEMMQKSPMGEARMKEEIRVAIRVNKVLEARLTNEWAVTDAELDEFSKENAGRLELPENVQARHILISFEPTDDDATKTIKRNQLEDIRKQILEGADFAEMARQHSKCPSASMGGDLGMFRRGQMVKPFEDAAFSQKVNEVGPVIETTFGYHLIQVLEHSEGGVPPKDKIVDALRRQKQQRSMTTFLQDLSSKSSIEYGPGMQQPGMPVMPQTPQ